MHRSIGQGLIGSLVASLVATVVSSAPAYGHVEGPFGALVGTSPRVDTVLNVVTGRLRIRNPSVFNRFVVCTLVVHTAGHRNITAAEATDGGLHASGTVHAGDTRRLRFRVNYDFGRRPHHLHLAHCHTPLD